MTTIDDTGHAPVTVVTDWGGHITREVVPADHAAFLAEIRRAMPGVVSVKIDRTPVTAKPT